MKNVCIIGGDLRQYYLAQCLRAQGYHTACIGVPQAENVTEPIGQVLENAEIAAFAIPTRMEDSVQLGANQQVSVASIAQVLPRNCAIFVAGVRKNGWFDYLEDAEFLQANAEITAEGALALCMQQLPSVVRGSRILTVGFGRIGKALAEKLSALGAVTAVSARSEKGLAEIRARGYQPLVTGQYGKLSDFACICNTVPAAVFTAAQVREILCPYIELASLPGGLAPDAAPPERLIAARGLPGRYAPQSAAAAMADFILRKTAI